MDKTDSISSPARCIRIQIKLPFESLKHFTNS